MSALDHVADRVFEALRTGMRIQVAERDAFGIGSPTPVEPVLQRLVARHPALLRGDHEEIPLGEPIRRDKRRGVGYATDHAGIAILKALFDRDRCEDWTYPMRITAATPLAVFVYRPQQGFERTGGYIHLLDREGWWLNGVESTWEWRTTRDDRPALGTIEVMRPDFSYPVVTSTKPLR